jgi:hypothetical protein
MAYASGRVFHDADSHVMETPDWLAPWADPGLRERLAPLYVSTVRPGEEHFIEERRRRHRQPEFRARDAHEIMLHGLPLVTDFHGGAENFRSVDYMAIPYPVMQTLATLIIDGVLDRFPALKFGVIEQGASWLPSFLRYLDSAQEAFKKSEERLRRSLARASDAVKQRFYCDNFVDLMGRGLAA